MKKYRIAIGTLLVLLLARSYADCSMITPSPLNYGVYDGTYLAPSVVGNGTLSVICTDTQAHTFCAHLTNLPSTSSPLPDQFYREPSRSTVMSTSDCFTPNNNGQPYTAICRANSPCVLPIYGKLSGGRVAEPRTYSSSYMIQLDVASQAAKSQTTLLTQTTVLAHASVTASSFSFGVYNPENPEGLRSAQQNVQVVATPNTNYTVSLSSGKSGNPMQRAMKLGSSSLAYNFYLPTSGTACGYNSVWPATGGLGSVGNGNVQRITLCGMIFKNQHPKAGAYSDTITVTVSY